MNRHWALLGILAAASGAALVVPACSSDNSTGGGSGSDAASDATTGGGDDASDSGTGAETSTPHDSGSDASDSGTTHDSGPADGSPEAATCAVFDASGLDEASVAAGFQSVWKVYKCWSCHQKGSQVVDEAGAGIVLSGNNNGLGDSGTIFPPNLTNDPTGLGCWSNAEVGQAILYGIEPNDAGTLCPPMSKLGLALQLPNDGGPKPGTPMDAGTLAEVIAYLRSLPPVSNTVLDTTCAAPAPSDAGSDAADAAADAPDAGD